MFVRSVIRSAISAVAVSVAAGGSWVVVASSEDNASISSSEFCSTVYSDYYRRQLNYFDPEGLYDIDSGAKHVPVLTLSDDGKTATVVVGNGNEENGVWHPMVSSDDPDTVHFVTHIMVKDQTGEVVVVKAMDPTLEGPASIKFDVPAGATELTPFEFCNIHGLWKGETVAIPGSDATLTTGNDCGQMDYPSGSWESVHADFLRQQKDTYNSTTVFTESDGEKHTPYITIGDDGKTASIFVGKDDGIGPVHPMMGSEDGVTEPHWITELYVVDDTGAIITMSSLDPTGVDAATLDFDIPEGAKTLTAYSWCNIHGLWAGPTVEVDRETSAVSGSADLLLNTASSVALIATALGVAAASCSTGL